MTEKKHTKPKRRKWPLFFLPVFVSLTILSATELLRPGEEQNEFEALSAMVHISESTQTEPANPTDPSVEEAQPENTEDVPASGTSAKEETEKSVLECYEPIYEKNPDLFGWIRIEGTVVDYPVMHSPHDPERYLHKNLSGAYSVCGVPFMAGECYDGCGNYILYGHNIRNGSMFHTILSYADESFRAEHPVICFDTLYQTGVYKVYAAFYSKAYYVDEENVFRVYDYTELTDEGAFYAFTEQAEMASLYDTGVDVEYGDTFITLITCSYHTENGRFIVIAVRDREA